MANLDIPHYLLVSSMSVNPSSMFMYLRVKGQAEEELKKKQLKLLSIIRPGLIAGRPDARLGEKIFGMFPVTKINCGELGRVMVKIAESKAE